MDVSGGSFGDTKVANLDRMNQRLCGVVVGMGMFAAGTVLICVTGMHISLLTIAKLALKDVGQQTP